MLAILFVSSRALAIDWTQYGIDDPTLCNVGCNEDWGSPQSRIVEGLAGCPGCSFTVVFYSRWCVDHTCFKIFIAGIFNNGNPCCSSVSLEDVANAFYLQYLQELSQDPMFYYYLTNCTDPSKVMAFNKATCMNGNEQCEPPGCCTRRLDLTWDENHHVTGVTPEAPAPAIYCPQNQGCVISCSYPDKGVEPVKCDLSCNTAAWTTTTATIPVNDCPNCSISVTYQYRTATDCNPVYYDYRILTWSHSGDCSGCFTGEDYLYSYILGWLLNNGGLPLPTQDGQCFTNYRVINSLCYHFVVYNINGIPTTVALECNTTECCYQYWKVCCHIQNGVCNYTWTMLPGGTPQNTYCDIPGCVTMCMTIPY